MFWKSVFVSFSSNQRLIWCFPNRGGKVSMGHFKEIEIGFINTSPPPIPIPGVAIKSYLQNFLFFVNKRLMSFYGLYWKGEKSPTSSFKRKSPTSSLKDMPSITYHHDISETSININFRKSHLSVGSCVVCDFWRGFWWERWSFVLRDSFDIIWHFTRDPRWHIPIVSYSYIAVTMSKIL